MLPCMHWVSALRPDKTLSGGHVIHNIFTILGMTSEEKLPEENKTFQIYLPFKWLAFNSQRVALNWVAEYISNIFKYISNLFKYISNIFAFYVVGFE